MESNQKPPLRLQHRKLDAALLMQVLQAGGSQEVDALRLYALLFSRFPNSILEENMEVAQALRWTKEKYKEAIEADWQFKRVLKGSGFPEVDDNLVVLYENLLVYFDVGQQKIRILYDTQSERLAFRLSEQLRLKFSKKEKRGEPRLHIVQSGYTGLATNSIVLQDEWLDIAMNYNDSLAPIHQRILEKLEDENAMGLVLLYGKPGTGKTTYLRHLITQTERPVLYIPVDLATDLGSPALMRIWNNFPNSICIIEDAERVLTNRGDNPNSPVASLLNLTDGFLAQCFHILFVCTFNTAISGIDPALTRKGRLLASYEFTELEINKAQVLSNSLGYHNLITKDMVLADIYHQ